MPFNALSYIYFFQHPPPPHPQQKISKAYSEHPGGDCGLYVLKNNILGLNLGNENLASEYQILLSWWNLATLDAE